MTACCGRSYQRAYMVKIIAQNKKPIMIAGFLVGYVFFWWWFYHGRDVAIVDKPKEDHTAPVENGNAGKRSEESESFDDLGNFWIEIMTDDVRIVAPIVEGVTDERLAQGVGHHATTSFPRRDGGNVVLSGHRWKFGKNPAYRVFEDLDRLKKDDHITLYYRGERFAYKITETLVVGGDDVGILEQTDVPTLTIYTCTPKYTALKRLVYRAELIH